MINMVQKRKLTIPPTKKGIKDTTIVFKILTNSADIIGMHKQRYRIYAKYGYLDLAQYNSEYDSDTFDKDNQSTYIGAFVDGYLLASIRVVLSDPLPIEKFFKFAKPDKIKNKNSIELSRLVIERTKAHKNIPRNIVMLFLADMTLDVARELNAQVGYAYLKEKLINKMRLLRMPVTSIDDFTCVYPKSSPMAPYFHDQKDDMPVPSFFMIDEIDEYLDSVLRNKKMFNIIDEKQQEYELKNSLYNKFLKTSGIL